MLTVGFLTRVQLIKYAASAFKSQNCESRVLIPLQFLSSQKMCKRSDSFGCVILECGRAMHALTRSAELLLAAPALSNLKHSASHFSSRAIDTRKRTLGPSLNRASQMRAATSDGQEVQKRHRNL